ncbi:MAG: glycosyltransferase family 2 protein [Gemmataceae bacterium]
MPLISVVVPVFHNAASVPDLQGRLSALAAANPGDTFEFVFVDDGSRDDSFAVLETLSRTDARIRVVKLSRNFGSNPAVLAGLSQARGAAVAVISADLQDPPELIGEMLTHWKSGRKVVVAARAGRADPLPVRLPANLFYALFRRGALPAMPPGGFDFCLIDRQVCDLLLGLRERALFLVGEILWLGFDPVVIPYQRAARPAKYGRSMWTAARRLRHLADAFAGFSPLPLRAAFLFGIAALLFGLLGGAGMLLALLFGREPAGWGIVLAVTLLLTGAQLLTLGVLGEYVWRALDNSRGRPAYVIDRVVERGSECSGR